MVWAPTGSKCQTQGHLGCDTTLSTYALSHFSCVTPWTIAHQVPLSMGFSRQGYWSGLPFPSYPHIVLTVTEELVHPGRQQTLAICQAGWLSLGYGNKPTSAWVWARVFTRLDLLPGFAPRKPTHLQCLKGIHAMIMSQIYKLRQCFKSGSNPSSHTYCRTVRK